MKDKKKNKEKGTNIKELVETRLRQVKNMTPKLSFVQRSLGKDPGYIFLLSFLLQDLLPLIS